jgi:hypothetical protein
VTYHLGCNIEGSRGAYRYGEDVLILVKYLT